MAAEVIASTPTASGGGGASGAAQTQASNGASNSNGVARIHPSDQQHSDGDDEDGAGSASRPPTASPVTSPPYWTHGQTHMFGGGGGGGGGAARGGHLRPGGIENNHSAESVVAPGAITLQDNETGPGDDASSLGGGGGSSGARGTERLSGRDRNRACWAKSVSVTDYVTVNSSATNIGAFVVWNIRVETLSGSYMNIRKRYSEFDDLREKLMMTFPNFEAAVPTLPPKSVISKFRPKFLEKRRSGLQYFLNCILLNPEFSGSPVLKEFLFS